MTENRNMKYTNGSSKLFAFRADPETNKMIRDLEDITCLSKTELLTYAVKTAYNAISVESILKDIKNIIKQVFPESKIGPCLPRYSSPQVHEETKMNYDKFTMFIDFKKVGEKTSVFELDTMYLDIEIKGLSLAELKFSVPVMTDEGKTIPDIFNKIHDVARTKEIDIESWRIPRKKSLISYVIKVNIKFTGKKWIRYIQRDLKRLNSSLQELEKFNKSIGRKK